MNAAARSVALPFALLGELAVAIASPVLLAGSAAVAAVSDRNYRVARAVLLYDAYVALELPALASLLRLSVAARGPSVRRGARREAYAIAASLLDRMQRMAGTLLDVHVSVDGDAAAVAALRAQERPLLVLSRHAGPGDSLLIAHQLLRSGRSLRVVLRAALRYEPLVGTLASLLPLCFVRRGHSRSDATLQRITRLAADMERDSALLLFPEGGDVSRKRVRRGITALLHEGMRRRARQAARLQHLGPPFPGGTLAALDGARDADVIFITHTGLAGMDVPPWRRVPVHMTLRMHLFHVPGEDVPGGEAARLEWLFDWWQRLDAWVDDPGRPRSTPMLGSVGDRVGG